MSMLSRRPHRLKETIHRGETALGTCLYSFSPALIELAGFCGLDFCRIDNEHAWRQDQSTEEVLRGGLLAGLVPLLRVDRDNPYLIRKAKGESEGERARERECRRKRKRELESLTGTVWNGLFII